ncbi:MAG: DUF418 domain-containing protein [Phycisphaerae bacterium]|jgi:uncharacterized protein
MKNLEDRPLEPSPAPHADRGPVTQSERIVSIDVLRGFAVLGILVMNIQSFAMPGSAYVNPTSYGDLTGLNLAVWLVSHALCDAKFMTIFSMLFGAGIILMTSRREQAGQGSAGPHYRRMGVLLVVALIHGYLLWYGDILYTYAMCGFLIYLFRKCQPMTLLIVGTSAIAIGSAISVFFGWSMQFWPDEAVDGVLAFWQPSAEAMATDLEIYRGPWLGQLAYRAPTTFFFQTFLFLFEFVWRAGGVMLVGMALHKVGVFGASLSSRTYGVLVALGLFVGIPVVLFGVYRNFAADWDGRTCFYFGIQFNYWGSLLVSLGWIGMIMLACKHDILPPVRRALAAAGQMAFTNYLMQTVICTAIFYGHGFALYGKVERAGQILIVFAVWVLQLVVSPFWLRYFRFGPMEWLWRSLTYGKPQPMRRSPPSVQ